MYDRRPLDDRATAMTRVAVMMRQSTLSLGCRHPLTTSLRIAIARESGRLDRVVALERGAAAARAGSLGRELEGRTR